MNATKLQRLFITAAALAGLSVEQGRPRSVQSKTVVPESTWHPALSEEISQLKLNQERTVEANSGYCVFTGPDNGIAYVAVRDSVFSIGPETKPLQFEKGDFWFQQTPSLTDAPRLTFVIANGPHESAGVPNDEVFHILTAPDGAVLKNEAAPPELQQAVRTAFRPRFSECEKFLAAQR